MKKTIAISLIAALIIISIITISTKYFKYQVYEVTYNIYLYSPETNDLSPYKNDCKFTLKAHSVDDAKEKTKDMLYLNSLCVSDKVVIKKVVEL
jgi:hypothetical protein